MAGATGDPPGGSLTDVLRRLGWADIVVADPFAATPADGRNDYREELLLDRLRDRLRSINTGPDRAAWLDGARLDFICDKLRRAEGPISSARIVRSLNCSYGASSWKGCLGGTVAEAVGST